MKHTDLPVEKMVGGREDCVDVCESSIEVLHASFNTACLPYKTQ